MNARDEKRNSRNNFWKSGTISRRGIRVLRNRYAADIETILRFHGRAGFFGKAATIYIWRNINIGLSSV